MALNVDKRILEKLRKLYRVSDRISQRQMSEILGLDETRFNELILDICEEFGWRIDGKYVVMNDDDELLTEIIETIDILDESRALDAEDATLTFPAEWLPNEDHDLSP